MSAVTASVAPSDSAPGVAHEDLGRVDVEPEEAEQGADDQRAQQCQVRLRRGALSRAMIMYATNAKTSVPPDSPSRPSVMLTPFAAATMAKVANTT